MEHGHSPLIRSDAPKRDNGCLVDRHHAVAVDVRFEIGKWLSVDSVRGGLGCVDLHEVRPNEDEPQRGVAGAAGLVAGVGERAGQVP